MTSSTLSRTAHPLTGLLAAGLCLTLAACGGTEPGRSSSRSGGTGGGGGGGGTRTGYTACNGAQCAPGQYCANALFCQNGCTSDLNCLPDQRCIDINSVTGDGICSESAAPPPPPPPPPQRDATCDGYAAHARECGLAASEAEAIRQSCDQLDADTKRALVACNASETCGELLSCSGIQCFTNAHCPPASPSCLTRAQVVDPLSDVPYTCR